MFLALSASRQMTNDRKTSPCKASRAKRQDKSPGAVKLTWPKDEAAQELDVENRELKKALQAQADEINRLKNNIARREEVTQRHLSSLGKNGAGVRGLIAAHIRLEEVFRDIRNSSLPLCMCVLSKSLGPGR